MNELVSKSEKMMTTKELAEVLNVSVDAIQKVVKKILAPTAVQRKVINGGKSMIFNEEQATLIKQEIQKHHNLKSRQIDVVSTEAEIIANYKQATEALVSMLNMKNQELKIQNDNLKIKLDESKEWYSIKRMEKLNKGQHFNWRLLKKESERMGVEVKEVFDANYGKVNAYHVSVWESLFFDTLDFGD